MMQLISTQNLSVSYGKNNILSGLNFTINQGEIIGLIGENGTGKTTLLNSLLGVLPTQGRVTIFGGQPGNKTARQKIGSMLQGDVVLRGTTVGEFLQEMASAYQNSAEITSILQDLELTNIQHKALTSLSGGQLRQVTFAVTLVGNPDLLFLDEPTVGMDVNVRQRFWTRIAAMREQGKTIIITSHYLEEIQHVADRLLILQNSHFIFQGSFAQLQVGYQQTRISFETGLPLAAFQYLDQVVAVKQVGSQTVLTSQDGDLTVRALVPKLSQISNLAITKKSLEELFMTLSKGKTKNESTEA